jgi:hypothetical protein
MAGSGELRCRQARRLPPRQPPDAAYPAFAMECALDHDDFGLNQSKIMTVIDSKSLEWNCRAGETVSTFPHPALSPNARRFALFVRCKAR